MKLNNQIYAFLLITLSTALTSVLAMSRTNGHLFSYWFSSEKKFCIPIRLSKCRFDIDKFNSCMKTERPMALYSIFAEIDAFSPIFPDKIGMYWGIGAGARRPGQFRRRR